MPNPSIPAILGGVPVRLDGPPEWPLADPEVQAALADAVADGAWGKYYGDHVSALEAELAAFHNVSHVVTCASGTLAVEAALRGLRVGPGDEVILAAYDYESNFLTVHAIGAKPVLIDIHPATWQLDPVNLTAAITSRTKAIVCSHLHGGIVPMQEVMQIARSRGIGVVEDAAQAPGAIVQGKPAGSWGDAGVLSFGGSKLLCAGRGGALLTSDDQLFQRARVFLHRGVQSWAAVSELQGAAVRPQLKKLPEMTGRRHANAASLVAAIRDRVPGLTPLADLASDSIPAFYKLGFQYDPVAFGLPRELFVKALRAEGVAFDAGFNGLHVGRSPSRFVASGDLSNARTAHERCVVLHHPFLALSHAEVQEVADAIAKIYRFRDQLMNSQPG
ncbi:MAG TPA: aminotransferase class V-fold PLP-dependent enzyme [Gemmata sp.]|nr:aminotransferase class V-fold PLP-dependent enzyme [Gemmata sp.]